MERQQSSEAAGTENLDIETAVKRLRERIDEEGANTRVEKLKSAIESSKALDRQIFEFQSNLDAKRSELESEIVGLEERAAAGCDSSNVSDELSESLEKLDLAKKDLAAKLGEILQIKRQLDSVPTHSELVQYERRFSELFVHIQEKHQQTQKYYATYNALLEIKELMLKETSLLNSINSQFQDAFTSSPGRMKLIDSMEKIVKGSQQKMEKAQLALREEQKVCDALKEKYSTAMADQRRCHSLLKAFQEECAKNEKLGTKVSVE